MKQRISIGRLERQFTRARDKGWLPHFYEAAEIHGFEPELLLAIASRETNLDLVWLTKPGDNGNGFGLMQVDAGTDRDFARSGKWKDARLGILRGAEILAEKRERIFKALGQGFVSVKDRSGKSYQIMGNPVSRAAIESDQETFYQILAASYNSGDWAVYHYLKRRDPDFGTTGGDYGADVVERADYFAKRLDYIGADKGLEAVNPIVPASVAAKINTMTGEGERTVTHREPEKPDFIEVATSSTKSLYETITAGSGVTLLTALAYLKDNPTYAILFLGGIVALVFIYYLRHQRHLTLDRIQLEAAADPESNNIRRQG